MPFHLDLAPFLTQFPGFVYEEGAALHSHDFFAVHVFFLDDIEQPAKLLVSVG